MDSEGLEFGVDPGIKMGSCLNLHRQFASLAREDDEIFLTFAAQYGFLWDGLSSRGKHVHSSYPESDLLEGRVSEPLVFWRWHAERIGFLIQLIDELNFYNRTNAVVLAERVLLIGHSFGEPVDCAEDLILDQSITGHPLFPGLWGHFCIRTLRSDSNAFRRLETYFPWVPEFDGSFMFSNYFWDKKSKMVWSFIYGSNIDGPPTTPIAFLDGAIKYVGDAISRSVQQYSLFKVCPYTGKIESVPQGVLGLCYTLLLRDFGGHSLGSQRSCAGCGKAFHPSRQDQLYCQDARGRSSSRCRQAAQRRKVQLKN